MNSHAIPLRYPDHAAANAGVGPASDTRPKVERWTRGLGRGLLGLRGFDFGNGWEKTAIHYFGISPLMGVYGFTNNMCLYTYMDYKPRILSGMHIFISKISAASNLKQFHFEVTKYVGRLKQQIMFTEG